MVQPLLCIVSRLLSMCVCVENYWDTWLFQCCWSPHIHIFHSMLRKPHTRMLCLGFRLSSAFWGRCGDTNTRIFIQNRWKAEVAIFDDAQNTYFRILRFLPEKLPVAEFLHMGLNGPRIYSTANNNTQQTYSRSKRAELVFLTTRL